METIHWAKRLAPSLLRRLYQSDAAGMLDEDLLEEVGETLYQRCRSILDVHSTKQGRARCQACNAAGKETWIERPHIRKEDWDSTDLVCPMCGWRVNWHEFLRSFKRHQLNSGGALSEFRRFAADYPRMRSSSEKMLAIDRLIHAFHYSFQARADMPSRPVGPNLIKGKLDEVITFLDELSLGEKSTPGLTGTRAAWESTLERYRKEYLGEFIEREKFKESDEPNRFE